jgi:S1-C subfamily serine protease
VVAVGDRPVTTPDRMLRILASYGADEQVTLRVRRKGGETTVVGTRGG